MPLYADIKLSGPTHISQHDAVEYADVQGTVYPKWPEICMYRYYCILCNTLYLL